MNVVGTLTFLRLRKDLAIGNHAVEAFQRHGFQVQPNMRHHEHRAYSQRGESNEDRVIVAGQIEYQAENRGRGEKCAENDDAQEPATTASSLPGSRPTSTA